MADASNAMTDPALPAVLIEISEVIGSEAMWVLVRECGGTSIYIPASIGQGHWLARLVGLESAKKLSLHFRDSTADLTPIGRKLLIPMASASQTAQAWRRVLDAQPSLTEIARQMGVHERTALRRRNRWREQSSEDQGDLFSR